MQGKSNQTPIPAIRVSNIARSLPFAGGQIDILHDISFEVANGECVALKGPSGSGKSTLLGILAGIDIPTSGCVEVAGMDITHLSERRLARFRNEQIGIIFQSFNLIPTLTALENVEVPLYVSTNRGSVRDRARRALDLVGLSDRLHHRPHQLSGGQQQRVAIARAIVNQPALLVADEPTGNLDSRMGAQVFELFLRLRDTLGLTLVIASHDPAIADNADRVLNLVDGRLMHPAAGPFQTPAQRHEPQPVLKGRG